MKADGRTENLTDREYRPSRMEISISVPLTMAKSQGPTAISNGTIT